MGEENPALRSLISECWDQDQEERPSFKDIAKRMVGTFEPDESPTKLPSKGPSASSGISGKAGLKTNPQAELQQKVRDLNVEIEQLLDHIDANSATIAAKNAKIASMGEIITTQNATIESKDD